MAAVAPAMQSTPLSTVSEAAMGSVSVSHHQIPVDEQALPKPPLSVNGNSHPFINWHNHNINNNVSATFSNRDFVPSPPSTMSSISQRSSASSSAIDLNNQSAQSKASVYFNTFKPRSKSFAVPAPTSCCPNCGLRRPSMTSDQLLSQSHLPSARSTHQRRPLPIHLHCPDFCPDDVMPERGAVMPGSPYHKRHHHRRRSSLCFAENLVDDAEVIDTGRIPPEVKQGWEQQAERIAKKVCLRESRSNSPSALRRPTMEG